MFPFHHLCKVAFGAKFERVVQVFHLSDLFYQNHLALYLVEVVDDVLLRPYQAVSRKLQFASQFEQDAFQLLVRGLLKEFPFIVQDQVLGRVDEPLYVDPLLVEVFQLCDFLSGMWARV